jgi:hypothetical protein
MDNVFLTANADLTEIAGIRTNGKIGVLTQKSVLSAFTSKVNGNLPEIVNALKTKLETDDEQFIIIAMHGELIRNGIKKETKLPFFPTRIWVDVSQLTWPLLFNRQIPNRTLDILAQHFNIPIKPIRDSADECTVLAQIYGQIMQRYSTALAGEETLREIGGETLDGIRKIVGF